jgi:hypothetical protein
MKIDSKTIGACPAIENASQLKNSICEFDGADSLEIASFDGEGVMGGDGDHASLTESKVEHESLEARGVVSHDEPNSNEFTGAKYFDESNSDEFSFNDSLRGETSDDPTGATIEYDSAYDSILESLTHTKTPKGANFMKFSDMPKCADGVDFEKVAKVCDLVSPYYVKKCKKFDEITIFYEGEKKLFKDLTPKQQIEMLEKGARGEDVRVVEKLKEKFGVNGDKFDRNEFKACVSKILAVRESEKNSFHGMAHALRASVLAEVVATVFSKIFKKFEGISSEEIEDAILAALCHDAGRQSDGVDIYEELSARIATEVLGKIGLSEDRIKRIADAIRGKDDDPNANKDRVAIILHEADFLEYSRLGCFDFKFSDTYNGNYEEENPQFNFEFREGVIAKDAQFALTLLACKAGKNALSTSNSCGRHAVFSFHVQAESFHLFDEKCTFVKSALPESESCNVFTEKMENVSAETIANFLSTNAHSKLFAHGNVFEISKIIVERADDIRNLINSRQTKHLRGKVHYSTPDLSEHLRESMERFSKEGYSEEAKERLKEIIIKSRENAFVEEKDSVPVKKMDDASMEKLKKMAKFCLTLGNEKWSEKMAQRTVFYRLKMIESGVFEVDNPKSLGDNPTVDKKFDTFFSIERSKKFCDYVIGNGGSWAFLECVLAAQIASSSSSLSVAVKQWLLDQMPEAVFEGKIGTFFPDNDSDSGSGGSDGKKKRHKTRKNSTSIFATFKTSQNFGGEKGRKKILDDFSKMSESFWIDTISGVARAGMCLPMKKSKEQLRCEEAISELKKLEDLLGDGTEIDYNLVDKSLDKIKNLPKNLGKTKKHLEELRSESMATHRRKEEVKRMLNLLVSGKTGERVENSRRELIADRKREVKMKSSLALNSLESEESVDDYEDDVPLSGYAHASFEESMENIDEIVALIGEMKTPSNSEESGAFIEKVQKLEVLFPALKKNLLRVFNGSLIDRRFLVFDPLHLDARKVLETEGVEKCKKSALFDETLYMLYAFTQESLPNIGGDAENETIQLYRYSDKQYFDSCIDFKNGSGEIESGGGEEVEFGCGSGLEVRNFENNLPRSGIIYNVAPYESYSVKSKYEDLGVFGNFGFSAQIPYHRIFFVPSIKSIVPSGIMENVEDAEGEMVAISKGCEATLIRGARDQFTQSIGVGVGVGVELRSLPAEAEERRFQYTGARTESTNKKSTEKEWIYSNAGGAH